MKIQLPFRSSCSLSKPVSRDVPRLGLACACLLRTSNLTSTPPSAHRPGKNSCSNLTHASMQIESEDDLTHLDPLKSGLLIQQPRIDVWRPQPLPCIHHKFAVTQKHRQTTMRLRLHLTSLLCLRHNVSTPFCKAAGAAARQATSATAKVCS